MGIKHQLYAQCFAHVEQRIATSREAIQAAQTAANEETKSSSGDKYETGRAMAQLEIEKNSEQLAEAKKLQEVLTQINPDNQTRVIQSGSLVTTNHGKFFIAIPAGQLTVDGEVYFAISKVSPIANHLLGLSAGMKFVFNQRNFVVEEVL